MRTICAVSLALGVVGAGMTAAEPEADDTVAKFRASFEKRMNAELDEHGRKARSLREGYLEALQKLKAQLGRQDNLKGAAQVVTEIDAIEEGDESDLADDADYRLKRLRKSWDEGLKRIFFERNEKLRTTVNLYLKALDDEKRKLTRAGKIKEALFFEEEENRVRGLPEVRAIAGSMSNRGKTVDGDVALVSRGASVSGASDARTMIDGDNVGNPNTFHHGLYASARWPCDIVVELGDVYVLNKIRIRLFDSDQRVYKFRVAVAVSKGNWTLVDDKSETGASSWQTIEFDPQDVRYIRVEGIHNSANERFHIIELEAYCPER